MLGHGGSLGFCLWKGHGKGRPLGMAGQLWGHRDIQSGFVSSLLMSRHWPQQVFHVGLLHTLPHPAFRSHGTLGTSSLRPDSFVPAGKCPAPAYHSHHSGSWPHNFMSWKSAALHAEVLSVVVPGLVTFYHTLSFLTGRALWNKYTLTWG